MTSLESFEAPRASSKFNTVAQPSLFFQHQNRLSALAMIVMVLRKLCFCVWSSIQAIRSFSMSDIDPFGIFISFFVLNEADLFTASISFVVVVVVLSDHSYGGMGHA